MNFIHQGRLEKKELERILNESKNFYKKSSAAGIYSQSNDKINKEVRKGKTYFTHTTESPNTYIVVQSIIIEKYSNFKLLDLSNLVVLQYAYYNPSDKFIWHKDVIRRTDKIRNIRALTMSINLSPSDSYKGGGLYLEHDNKVIELDREQGSYIIFPSFLLHKADEVTSGRRTSLVVWLETPHDQQAKFEDLYYSIYKKHK